MGLETDQLMVVSQRKDVNNYVWLACSLNFNQPKHEENPAKADGMCDLSDVLMILMVQAGIHDGNQGETRELVT